MHVRPIALSLIALSGLAFSALQDPVTVKWTPKPGAVLKYKVNVVAKGMQGPTGPGELKFGATLTRTIKEIQAGGNVVVEETQSELTVMFDGQDYTSQIPMTSLTSTLTCQPNGEVVDRKTDQSGQMDSPRLDNAMTLVFSDKPLAVGDIWKRETAADTAKGLFPTVTTYTYRGMEMIDGKYNAYKIDLAFEESGAPANMSANGTIWVDSADGEVVKGNYAIKNVEFGPGVTADADSTIQRID